MFLALRSVTPAQQPAPGAATIALDTPLPLDPGVRVTVLPNGLTAYVRHNEQPAKRLSLRLAVKAGSINEDDDQQGLAHLIEHMAFNGSTHFTRGEVFAYFESIGAQLGPHVNAYTNFDETVYRLDLPTDKPEVIQKGFTALADFAGGLTLDPAAIDKERSVVIEEWRLGLGATSRIRDKQFPVLFYRSRYAERLPIGKPDVIRSAPAARLRDFYDTWYRPERMAVVAVGDLDASQLEQGVRDAFGSLTARAPAKADPDRTVPLHPETLVNVATDPEVTQSTVSILHKRPRQEAQKVADYRKDLVQRLVDRMIDERFSETAREADAKFLSAGASSGAMSQTVDTFSLRANAENGMLQDAATAIAIEAKRVREFGFGPSELDRAKRWLLSLYDRSYNERNKTDSGSYAQEYVSLFLDHEPAPGIEYEYRLATQLVPSITAADVSTLARTLLASDSRVMVATSPQKAGVRVPSESDLKAALETADRATVTPYSDAPASRELLPTKPKPGDVVERRELPKIGVTVVRFSNGIEAWLKPTDFKDDQILFTLDALGGASLAPQAEFPEATVATSFVGLSGVGGLKALELQKLLTGTVASASPYISLSTHGIAGSANPAGLETALKLLFLDFTAPNDDPDAFALMKRQLEARVANREQSPGQVFGERASLINSSNHYTAQPITVARVGTLDRSKIMAFYRQRFSNARDFTFFMVGAFKTDEAIPLLAQYLGSLPATDRTSSRFVDLGMRFPDQIQRERVQKGREPQSQTVLSFFAEPSPVPIEQEKIIHATTVLELGLREILRAELGQTYSVGVGLAQPLPQRGSGHIEVRFGSAPENVDAMIDRVLKEIKRLQEEQASADLLNRSKQSARSGYETALRENGYWLRRLATINMIGGDPNDILTRNERIDSITLSVLQDVFKKSFPLDRYTVVTLVPAPVN